MRKHIFISLGMVALQGCASLKGAEINLSAFGNPKTAVPTNSNIPMITINIPIDQKYISGNQNSHKNNLLDNISSQGKEVILGGTTAAILIALIAPLFKKKEVATGAPVGGGIK